MAGTLGIPMAAQSKATLRFKLRKAMDDELLRLGKGWAKPDLQTGDE